MEVCVCEWGCIYVGVYVYVNEDTYVCVCKKIHMDLYTWGVGGGTMIHMCGCVCVCKRIHIRGSVCVCTKIYMYVGVCVCI